MRAASLELLIVTSRGRGRWIIPKGWPIKGFKPHEWAAREAFEEAGIRGEIGTKTIGTFPYEKIADDESRVNDCEIVVFPLRVKRQLKSWPEAGERELLWINPKDIAALIHEDGLRRPHGGFRRPNHGKGAPQGPTSKGLKA